MNATTSDLMKFNYYLAQVRMDRSFKEISHNQGNINPKVLNVLEAIRTNNLAWLKRLHAEGIYVRGYKAVQYALAARYGHVEMLEYLYENQCYNINYACFEGMMRMIAEHGSGTTFKRVYEKYKLLLEKELTMQEPTVRAYYASKHCANFTEIFYDALLYNNMNVAMEMWKCKEVKDKIDAKWCIERAKKDVEYYGERLDLSLYRSPHLILDWFESFTDVKSPIVP